MLFKYCLKKYDFYYAFPPSKFKERLVYFLITLVYGERLKLTHQVERLTNQLAYSRQEARSYKAKYVSTLKLSVAAVCHGFDVEDYTKSQVGNRHWVTEFKGKVVEDTSGVLDMSDEDFIDWGVQQ